MKIYTRTGDTGETSLFGGTRARKSDPRVDAYGALEEDLNIHLQVFRLGDILFTICPCEQWADQARNIKTRTDVQQGNQYYGYDWSKKCTAVAGGWSCPG